MAVQHNHWRNLTGAPNVNHRDRSTGAILKSLAKPRDPKPVTAHANVASVNTDGGVSPTMPKSHGGNRAANARFNKRAQTGPRERPNTVMVTGR